MLTWKYITVIDI